MGTRYGPPFFLGRTIAPFAVIGGQAMRIARPLLKLPIEFDAAALAAEVAALPGEAWLDHPQNFDGNDGVPLVSPGGEDVNSAAGPMAPTRFLAALPFVRKIMGALDSCWGRSRLMGLATGAEVPLHVDAHYYWRTHLRIHIPVITNPGVRFHVRDESYHLKVGECWILDSFHPHRVENSGTDKRVHLVLDTVGSERLFELMRRAEDQRPLVERVGEAGPEPYLRFEQRNFPTIMSPWEIESHIHYVRSWVPADKLSHPVFEVLSKFLMQWAGTWAEFGDSAEATPSYRALIDEARQATRDAGGPRLMLTNDVSLQVAIGGFVFAVAIGADRERLMRPMPTSFAARAG